MTRILLVAAALAAFTGAAQAADVFAGLYGNTLTITGSDGAKSTVFINQDMTWEQHMANGAVMKGTYAWKDPTTACFTQTDPAPKAGDPSPNCFGGQAAHNVGDSWTVSGGDGKPATLTLTAGR